MPCSIGGDAAASCVDWLAPLTGYSCGCSSGFVFHADNGTCMGTYLLYSLPFPSFPCPYHRQLSSLLFLVFCCGVLVVCGVCDDADIDGCLYSPCNADGDDDAVCI